MKKLLRLKEVVKITGLGKSTVYKKIKNEGFPVPVKIGPGLSCWVSEEIQEWIQSQINIRNNKKEDK